MAYKLEDIECYHNYGVLKRIQRSDVDHLDETYKRGEKVIEEFFEDDSLF